MTKIQQIFTKLAILPKPINFHRQSVETHRILKTLQTTQITQKWPKLIKSCQILIKFDQFWSILNILRKMINFEQNLTARSTLYTENNCKPDILKSRISQKYHFHEITCFNNNQNHENQDLTNLTQNVQFIYWKQLQPGHPQNNKSVKTS